MPLEALTTIADKVMEVASPAFFSVNVAPLTSKVAQLRSEVVQLCEMIVALQVSNIPYRCSHSRPKPPSATRSNVSCPAPMAPAEQPPAFGLFWYHCQFGDTT